MGFLIPRVQEATVATYFMYLHGNWDTEGYLQRKVNWFNLESFSLPANHPGDAGSLWQKWKSVSSALTLLWPDLPNSAAPVCFLYTLYLGLLSGGQGLDSWHSMTGKAVRNTECESSVLRSQPHFRANTSIYKPVLLPVVGDTHSPPYLSTFTSLSS